MDGLAVGLIIGIGIGVEVSMLWSLWQMSRTADRLIHSGTALLDVMTTKGDK